MSSSKLILIFLGFIFLAIILLSSNKISAALRKRFAGFLPPMKVSSQLTPTPSPTIKMGTPTPTIKIVTSNQNTGTGKFTGSPANEIPATGPAEVSWLLLGGSAFVGVALKRLTNST